MLSDLQEVLERSIFHAIREKTVAEGYLPDIKNYDISNVSDAVAKAERLRYESDKTTIATNKGFVIDVFGVSNNQQKAEKKVPRIVIDTNSFQPGMIGGDTTPVYELIDGVFVKSSSPSLASDYFFSVYAVSNTIKQHRILTAIISSALPRRGYIKTYLSPNIELSGNILTVFLSSNDSGDLPEGIMEKSFSYQTPDVFESLPDIIDTKVLGVNVNVVPITEIKLETLSTIITIN